MKPGARCYFSFRSPYAWLALRTLEERGLGIGSALEYVPYFEPPPDLRADLEARGGRVLYAPMSRERHLYILSDVKRTLKAAGIAPRWPVDDNPDWSVPHLAYLACPDDRVRRAFAMAVFEARWLRGANVWHWDAVEAYLGGIVTAREAAAIVGRARSAATAQQAVEALYRAYMDDVFGVPFLIVGREKFWGNDRVEQFIAAQAAAPKKEYAHDTTH